eukprot:gene16073-22210_t
MSNMKQVQTESMSFHQAALKELGDHLGSDLNSLHEQMNGFRDEMSNMKQVQTESMISHQAAFAPALKELSDRLDSDLNSLGERMTEEMSNMKQVQTESLSSHQAAFAPALKELSDRLDSDLNSLVENMSFHQGSFAPALKELSDRLDSDLNSLDERVNEATASLVELKQNSVSPDRVHDMLEFAISTRDSEMKDSIENQAEEMAAQLQELSDRLYSDLNSLDERVNETTASLVELKQNSVSPDRVHDMLEFAILTRDAEMKGSIENQAEEVAAPPAGQEQLKQATARLIVDFQDLRGLSDEFNARLDETLQLQSASGEAAERALVSIRHLSTGLDAVKGSVETHYVSREHLKSIFSARDDMLQAMERLGKVFAAAGSLGEVEQSLARAASGVVSPHLAAVVEGLTAKQEEMQSNIELLMRHSAAAKSLEAGHTNPRAANPGHANPGAADPGHANSGAADPVLGLELVQVWEAMQKLYTDMGMVSQLVESVAILSNRVGEVDSLKQHVGALAVNQEDVQRAVHLLSASVSNMGGTQGGGGFGAARGGGGLGAAQGGSDARSGAAGASEAMGESCLEELQGIVGGVGSKLSALERKVEKHLAGQKDTSARLSDLEMAVASMDDTEEQQDKGAVKGLEGMVLSHSKILDVVRGDLGAISGAASTVREVEERIEHLHKQVVERGGTLNSVREMVQSNAAEIETLQEQVTRSYSAVVRSDSLRAQVDEHARALSELRPRVEAHAAALVDLETRVMLSASPHSDPSGEARSAAPSVSTSDFANLVAKGLEAVGDQFDNSPIHSTVYASLEAISGQLQVLTAESASMQVQINLLSEVATGQGTVAALSAMREEMTAVAKQMADLSVVIGGVSQQVKDHASALNDIQDLREKIKLVIGGVSQQVKDNASALNDIQELREKDLREKVKVLMASEASASEALMSQKVAHMEYVLENVTSSTAALEQAVTTLQVDDPVAECNTAIMELASKIFTLQEVVQAQQVAALQSAALLSATPTSDTPILDQNSQGPLETRGASSLESQVAENDRSLNIMRSRMAALQEYVDSTHGLVKELHEAHGMVMSRIDGLEGGGGGAKAPSRALQHLQELHEAHGMVMSIIDGLEEGGGGAAGAPSCALQHLQSDVYSLESKFQMFEVNHEQVGRALKLFGSMSQRLEIDEQHTNALQDQVDDLAQKIPQIQGMVKGLEGQVNTRNDSLYSAYRGLSPAGSNPSIMLVEMKIEAMRRALANSMTSIYMDLDSDRQRRLSAGGTVAALADSFTAL